MVFVSGSEKVGLKTDDTKTKKNALYKEPKTHRRAFTKWRTRIQSSGEIEISWGTNIKSEYVWSDQYLLLFTFFFRVNIVILLFVKHFSNLLLITEVRTNSIMLRVYRNKDSCCSESYILMAE